MNPLGNRTPKRFALSSAQRVSLEIEPNTVREDATQSNQESKLNTTPILRSKKAARLPKTPVLKNSGSEETLFKMPLSSRPNWDDRPAPKTEKTRTNLTPRPAKADGLLVNQLRGLDINTNDSALIDLHSKKLNELENTVAELKKEIEMLKLKFTE